MTTTATYPAPLETPIRGCRPDPRRRAAAHPALDVVIPVLNEERVLRQSTVRLQRHLEDVMRVPFAITIVDNGSTDATPEIAAQLACEIDGVRTLRLQQRGRGRALRAAWSASDADVVAYMDVDLSTDLRHLGALVDPLLADEADVSLGTRLDRRAHVTRGRERELISRAYNRILKTALHARFSDAQCGFKALRRDAAAVLLPLVEDEAWFFDTELLHRAEVLRMRVHEVPVRWVDDPDSRVRILRTAIDDLRGVRRLRRELRATRSGPAGRGRARAAHRVVDLRP